MELVCSGSDSARGGLHRNLLLQPQAVCVPLKVSTARNDSVSSARCDLRKNGFQFPCRRLSTWRPSMLRPVGHERTRHSLHETYKKAVTCCASWSAAGAADRVAQH